MIARFSAPLPTALIYDFDGTLAPGNIQEHSLLHNHLQISVADFWARVAAAKQKHDADQILVYMQELLKRATMDQMHQVAKSKVEELMNQNPTRKDLYEKLEALIADYNAGSHNVQESFEQIRDFIDSLNTEEQRHVKEDLSEEELAIFDLLTKPNVERKKKDRQAVKDLAKGLIARLKADQLVLDWKKKRQAKARVRRCIEDTLDPLPEDAYSDELYEEKCTLIFEHVFESYWGDGASKYGEAG